MILYHASKEIIEFPEIRKTKYAKDFSWGFYCTIDFKQAVRWANRGEGTPIINYYSYEPIEGLSILKFDRITDDWLDFIARCRSGETHPYDIVEGPMAEFRYPTHQISFHMLSALNCLTFERSEILHDRKGKK